MITFGKLKNKGNFILFFNNIDLNMIQVLKALDKLHYTKTSIFFLRNLASTSSI